MKFYFGKDLTKCIENNLGHEYGCRFHNTVPISIIIFSQTAMSIYFASSRLTFHSRSILTKLI